MVDTGHIEKIENKRDIKLALGVSLESFYPNSITNYARSIWENKWFNDPYSEFTNIYINKYEDNIIAGLRTVYRTIYRNDQKFNVLGIAETFVNSSHQKKGIADSLTKKVIAEHSNGGTDLALVVARKNIDNFYLKYKAYGLGSYSKATFKIKKKIDNKFDITPLNHSNISTINRIYNSSYKNCFGRVMRNIKYWEFLMHTAHLLNINFYVLLEKNSIIGYFALSGKEIVEIGVLPGNDNGKILTGIYHHFPQIFQNYSLELNISKNHNLLKDNIKYDVTVCNRECYFGGHIIKILNLNRVTLMAQERLKKTYEVLNITSAKFNVDKLNVIWNGSRVEITYPKNHEPTYKETLFLLGVEQIYCETIDISNIGRVPFKINRLDEI